uniref:Uncharacterized protein n=1 Tax=Anguilla anguilla TaxID=7936 RepID=A0A0E9WG55_ANGAN
MFRKILGLHCTALNLISENKHVLVKISELVHCLKPNLNCSL